MLFPIHRLQVLSSSCLIRRPSFLSNKFVFRWIALACILIALTISLKLRGPRLADILDLGPFHFDDDYPPPLAPHLERPLNPPSRPTKEEQAVWEPRKDQVREAFKHAWSGYKTIAYPNDELLSLSGGASNKLRFLLLLYMRVLPLILSKLNYYQKKI